MPTKGSDCCRCTRHVQLPGGLGTAQCPPGLGALRWVQRRDPLGTIRPKTQQLHMPVSCISCEIHLSVWTLYRHTRYSSITRWLIVTQGERLLSNLGRLFVFFDSTSLPNRVDMLRHSNDAMCVFMEMMKFNHKLKSTKLERVHSLPIPAT